MIILDKFKMFILLIVLNVVIISACSNETEHASNEVDANNQSQEEVENTEDESLALERYDGEPVTLKVLIAVDEQTFKIRYQDPMKEKFPNMTLELISGSPRDANLIQELYASDNTPDISISPPSTELVKELDFLMPIDDYIEHFNFDLRIIKDGIIEGLRQMDPLKEGQLYGLPVENRYPVLFYNKDIFDTLGEPFPEDGMTWDEVLDLARRMTVKHGDEQYIGLTMDPWSVPFLQLGVPGTDPETGEVLFTEDERTHMFFDFLDDLRSIPNFSDPDIETGFNESPRNIAMAIWNAPWLELLPRDEDFNFDLVTIPTWKGQSQVSPVLEILPFNIIKHSENKAAAWEFISFFASEEGQAHLSRVGSPPVVKSEEVYEQFAAEALKDLEGDYNVKAPFQYDISEIPPYSPYDEDQYIDFIGSKANNFVFSELDKDVNTYLREIQEEYSTLVLEKSSRE